MCAPDKRACQRKTNADVAFMRILAKQNGNSQCCGSISLSHTLTHSVFSSPLSLPFPTPPLPPPSLLYLLSNHFVSDLTNELYSLNKEKVWGGLSLRNFLKLHSYFGFKFLFWLFSGLQFFLFLKIILLSHYSTLKSAKQIFKRAC